MTSNHGDHLNNQEASTLDNKGFQIVPILNSTHMRDIYTIFLKYGLIGPF